MTPLLLSAWLSGVALAGPADRVLEGSFASASPAYAVGDGGAAPTDPWWRPTIAATIASPSPVPPEARLRDLSAR